MSEAQQLVAYEAFLDAQLYNPPKFDNPTQTRAGNGKLQLHFPENVEEDRFILIGLLFKVDEPDFLRLYPGQAHLFHDLAPGHYRYIGWGNAHSYLDLDSLEVRPDGSSHYRIDSLQWQQADSIMQAMYQDASRRWHDSTQADTLRQRIKEIEYYYSARTSDGKLIRGKVVDWESGEPLLAATIRVIDLTGQVIGGAYTGLDGDFEVFVPPGAVLKVSYLGYETQTVYPSQLEKNQLYLAPHISLRSSASTLDEMVIVGYGKQRRSDVTAAISTVSGSGVPGVGGISGRAAGVMVRGARDSGTSLIFIDGMPVSDASFLSDDQIKNMELLSDAAATTIYGSRGANGVVLITTQGKVDVPENLRLPDLSEPEIPLEDLLEAPASMRSNFSDLAYWKPTLRTDERGEVRFEVTFPDDITRWEQFGLVYDARGRRTGQTQASLPSYQALMAQLSLPRFLVEGNQTTAFGKARNLTGDSVQARLSFLSPDETYQTQDLLLGPAALDTLLFTAPSGQDSLRLSFRLDLPQNEYFDGEQRDIPLFPKGDKTTEGYFWLLAGDSSVEVDFPAGEVHIAAKSSLLDLCLEEVEWVRNYRYYCNEQAASKLKVLLVSQRIYETLDEEFPYERDAKDMIRRLMKGRNEDNLWGWWVGNQTSYWISTYVIEALTEARLMGYQVDLNLDILGQELAFALTTSRNYLGQQVDLLWLLHRLQKPINFPQEIATLEADTLLTLTDHLRLQRLRQELSLPYQLDTLWKYQKETLHQGLYWGGKDRNLRYSSIEATLQAYDLLRKDEGDHSAELLRIQAWLLAQRRPHGWGNTYQSARILETLLPGLLEDGELPQPPMLIVEGQSRRDTIQNFPYQGTWSDEPVLRIRQVGNLPAYVSAYQQYFAPEPKAVDSTFVLHSWWNDAKHPDTLLNAGQSATLTVEVTCTEDAEYVLIEVPIPAGCSYAEQGLGHGPYEVYREQRRDRVAICCRRLPAGTYRYQVRLQPRFPGTYTLNPARIEEMYFPVFFGRNAVKEVGIGRDL